MLNFILRFMLAWFIVSVLFYTYASRIMCPDMLFYCLSFPMQIISIPYYLIKEKRKKKMSKKNKED